MKLYYVYIASNWNHKVLYTGITNDILRRMLEHKTGKIEGFTKKYRVNKLLFIQEYNNPSEAIAMEKKIKGWIRAKKISLVESMNPEYKDLAAELDPSLRSG